MGEVVGAAALVVVVVGRMTWHEERSEGKREGEELVR